MAASSHCAWHVVGLHAVDGGWATQPASSLFSQALEGKALAACEQCGGDRKVQTTDLVNALRPVGARLLPYGEDLATSASMSISAKLPGNAGHG